MTKTLNDGSRAGRPGGLQLSRKRAKRFVPEAYPLVMPRDERRRASLQFWQDRLPEHLSHGNACAAVVLQTAPLPLIACYATDFDWAVVCRFPAWVVAEHGLQPGSRLLCCNLYGRSDVLERDIQFGPNPGNHTWANFHPIIADFLTDDAAGLERLKATISEAEWQRCWQAGQEYLAYTAGQVRSGNWTYAGDPAPLPGER